MSLFVCMTILSECARAIEHKLYIQTVQSSVWTLGFFSGFFRLCGTAWVFHHLCDSMIHNFIEMIFYKKNENVMVLI